MSRCTNKRNLEVHHIRRDGGNGLNNAQVLCNNCHANTSSYGTPGKSPEAFTSGTIIAALVRSGHQCECQKANCH